MDIEFESQVPSEVQEEEEFNYYKPQNRKSKLNSIKTSFELETALERCKYYKRKILEQKLEETGKEIFNSIKLNPKNKSLIMPIKFKRSQSDIVELFISKLVHIIEETAKQEKHQCFLDTCDKFDVIRFDRHEVKSLAFEIYQWDQEKKVESNIAVYVSEKITNLSPNNVYVFSEGISHVSYILVSPTYEDFWSYDFQSDNSLDVIPLELFNPKELFCQFMLKTLSDPDIKAYLPSQALCLIQDYDYYPLSYQQGCRRLEYCIMKFYMVLDEKGLLNKMQYVPFQSLIDLIEEVIKKIFTTFYRKKLTEKNIKCVLDEGDVYSGFHVYLNKIQYWKNEGKNQVDLICQFRNRLRKKLNDRPEFANYAPILDGEEVFIKTGQKKLKKKGREDLFQIKPEIYKDQKNVLEDQITKIIHLHTKPIRVQASYVKWEQINYANRIRPQIPLHIFKVVCQDPKKRQILDQIMSNSSVSLVRLFNSFCGGDEEKFGELIYWMRDLELHGLIDVGKTSINPQVTPNFFPKATFNKQSQLPIFDDQ